MSSEFRFDPLHRRWVIVSRQRAQRPNEFTEVRYQAGIGQECPFCEGNENQTPPEILALRPGGSAPDGPGWTLRVVPNRFPAVAENSPGGFGRHEVLIESNQHDVSLDELEPERRLDVIRAYRDRVAELGRDERIDYVVLFRNSGPRSGASLSHPHTQIMGLRQTPTAMDEELRALREHHRDQGRCLACELVGKELEQGERVLSGEGEFVSYLPYAGRFPGELIVTSREHPPPFCELDEAQLGRLNSVLMDALRRMRGAFSEPSFNWVMHTVAGDRADLLEGGHHWRFEILPRLGQLGGFELGTGMYINSIPPEQAVARLRRVVE